MLSVHDPWEGVNSKITPQVLVVLQVPVPPSTVVPYRFPDWSKTTSEKGLSPSAPAAKRWITVSFQAQSAVLQAVGCGESLKTVPCPMPPFCVVPYRAPSGPIITLACGLAPSVPPAKL